MRSAFNLKIKSKGFSLMEIVIAAGLAMVIGTYLVRVWVNNNVLYNSSTSVVSGGLNLNDITTQVGNQIKQAAEVASGYPETSPLYLTGSSTLVLKLPAIKTTGTFTDVFDYVVISPDKSNTKLLRMQVLPDSRSMRKSSDQVLSNILSGISFSYMDQKDNSVSPKEAAKIKVDVSVLYKTGSIGSVRTATIITGLRNI